MLFCMCTSGFSNKVLYVYSRNSLDLCRTHDGDNRAFHHCRHHDFHTVLRFSFSNSFIPDAHTTTQARTTRKTSCTAKTNCPGSRCRSGTAFTLRTHAKPPQLRCCRGSGNMLPADATPPFLRGKFPKALALLGQFCISPDQSGSIQIKLAILPQIPSRR